MRKALLAAALLAGLGAPAAAMDLSPNVAPNNPALGHWSGRWSLCRIHLEKQGYPYSYLRRSGRGGSRGILSACSRELWRKHHRMA
jgi:opacity protein-like surface antigen